MKRAMEQLMEAIIGSLQDVLEYIDELEETEKPQKPYNHSSRHRK